MISVVIPALNEAPTIASVVQFAWRAAGVRQVIVVDDGSIDDTVPLALAAGAQVMTSTLLGKGASMRDGLLAASQNTIVYLDGDLRGLSEELIPRLSAPVLAHEADFVKARFARHGGRVTALTAKPLLRSFFPELASLEQPLGGIVAARRSLLEQLEFETDFGVDIGLVIDSWMVGARLLEVDVGQIEHDSQPLDSLQAMAFQVASTIFDRACRHGRLRPSLVREARIQNRRECAERYQTNLPRLTPWRRLALFDMDGVLLQGRFVVELARHCGREAALAQLLDSHSLPPELRTKRIGGLFRGVPFETFDRVAAAIPLTPGASDTVVALRRLGYHVGIVTDSYAVAAEVVRRRVFADFCVGHLLHFRRGCCQGRLSTAPLMKHRDGCPLHRVCKTNVLLHLLGTGRSSSERVLVVGDGENDVCLLEAVDLAFAFEPKCQRVAEAARQVIHGDLRGVLQAVQGRTSELEAPVNPRSLSDCGVDSLRQPA